jgi:hypothetical protein
MIPFRNLPLSGQSDDASTLITPQALELGLLGPTLTPQGCHLRFRCSKSVQWYIRENCTGRF